MKKISFTVQGMTCDHCARMVEQTLLQNPKVMSADVSYSEGLGEVAVEEDISFSQLKMAVRKAGYDLSPLEKESARTASPTGYEPQESKRHVVIIGAGSGAFAAAIRASDLGARVTLIERGTLGGTCVNVGCVPSKILIRQAYHVHQPLVQPFDGISSAIPAFSDLLLKKQRERRVLELREEKYTQILRTLPNVTFLEGTASLENDRTVHVRLNDKSERFLSADRILIATGARPSAPNIPGLSATPFWTSTEALFSETVPRHMIVLGGGFVAVEIGQAYRRLGAEVTIIERNAQILNRMEPDLGKALQTYLEEEGIKFLFNAEPRKIEYHNRLFRVAFDDLTLEGDALLVATGRTPNTENLALEKAGVRTSAEGAIVVNEKLETNVQGIYAVGDCTTFPKFVYVAAASGTRAAINMLESESVFLDLSVLPEVIFTDPQVAVVGLTESAALSHGLQVETRILSLDQVPRALANFDTRGWVKMVAEKTTGRLVGVQILAPEGGEVIQTAAMALQAKRTVRDIGDQFFPYLTMVESLKLCAQSFHRDVKQLSCCAG
ncbi:MAG: mercury(II) reductase [Nitrospirota bacterium]|nr:mercury(II) reductase [Nitrospirota bacterium]